MNPPSRSHPKRRAVSAQISHAAPFRYAPEGSPSPFAPTADTAPSTRRPKTSHTVSVGWDEGDDTVTHSTARLNIELAECVETKTITTTTTTKRSYPPLFMPKPQALENLDPKRYPLASKPTPLELSKFSYEVDGQMVSFREDEPSAYYYEDLRDNQNSSPVHSSKEDELSDVPAVDDQQSERVSRKKAVIIRNRSSRGMPAVRGKAISSGRGQMKKTKDFEGHHSTDEERPSTRERRPRHRALDIHNTTLPATPDASELDQPASNPSQISSLLGTSYTPKSGLSQSASYDEAASPTDATNEDVFPSAVATPPIAESDLEPFESVNAALAQSSAQRPSINTLAAQNASLPSPGLSPTFAPAELHVGPYRDNEMEELGSESPATQSGDSQATMDGDYPRNPKSRALKLYQKSDRSYAVSDPQAPSILEARTMMETFDSMSDDMKSFMMYQFLRRCSRKTLHVIADVVNPALKCDFLDQLPAELSLHILSFLDHKDLCRAARVSKQWRNVIDTNETGWKELLDRDGYVLPQGELERAIHQGWGWQDPYGPDGFEQDFSTQGTPIDAIMANGGLQKMEAESRKVRSTTKRKRVMGSSSSERAKRRAVSHEFANKAQEMISKYPSGANFHKSEGPLTAANAAALAVPDPQLGLPSLRKLHLFKSLYRRRSMIKRSWTNSKFEPHHLAFPAHPAHVITCLQFDDDKILTGSDDTLIHVYDTKTGQLRKKLEGHEGGVWALQYEGNVLVSGSTDRSVRVWDIEKGLCTQVFHGHTSTVRCLQILMPTETGQTEKGKRIMVPEKPLIITGSRDSQLRVWKLPEQGSKRYIQTGPPANDADCPYFVRVLNGHNHSVRAIAAHQDTLVSGSYDFTVRVWKISTGETVHRLQGHTMKVYSVVLDHKRDRCISGSMDNFVKIWSLETGACLFTLEGHTSLVGLLDLRDERLVSAAADSTLRIWDPENGQCKSTLSAHTGAITCFQHDGQKVISGSDRTLKMWNVKTGECIKDLLTDLSGVWQVKFDERRCVAAVQRDNLTFVEVLDFGASRDGIPASQRGSRILLNNDMTDRITEVEDV
ncbi:hypothetical protein BP6252_00742 [Coleophoma cylindrospora]|uniref:F-box domain-containing protein n=1 Tax=Coleophoma cylindrospora TaxID=1849047 RepID=A0A3D8SQW1_9HELO|nr:hypothetical protein BP6252_00742 [Coleophoma cylindrospora]